MTKLQDAMWAAFGPEYTFGASGKFKVPTDQMPDEAIVALFRYGRRLYNDNWNSSSAKTEGKTQEEFFAKWYPKLGESVGTGHGGGGPSLTFEERAERAILETLLREIGHKAALAKKMSADTEAAWAEITANLLKAQFGAEFNPENVEVIEANTETVREAYREEIMEKALKLKKAAEKTSKISKPLGLKL